MGTLVLLRHGQSQWNLENRFTGWWDVDLSSIGEKEASSAGSLLAAASIAVDLAYTSVLTRAVRTLDLALEEMALRLRAASIRAARTRKRSGSNPRMTSRRRTASARPW